MVLEEIDLKTLLALCVYVAVAPMLSIYIAVVVHPILMVWPLIPIFVLLYVQRKEQKERQRRIAEAHQNLDGTWIEGVKIMTNEELQEKVSKYAKYIKKKRKESD